MRTRFFIYTLLVINLLSSCTTLMYTSIDVLRPAKVTFDKSASKLLIINNSVIQSKIVGHRNELLNEKVKNVTVNTDSLAIFCLSVVKEEFLKNDFFNSTELTINSINTSGNFSTPRTPKSDTLQALISEHGADVVLSLDKIKVADRIVEYYNEESNSFYAMLEANFESTWSVTNAKSLKSETYLFKDTIYWDAESYQRKKALSGLPDRYNALIDGALYVGQSAMKKFVPWWDKEDRYFFVNQNKGIKQGMDSVFVKNWSAAIQIWEKALLKASNPEKAKLNHNISVAYEISGDLKKAIEYNLKASKAYESTTIINFEHYFTIKQYELQLQERNKEVQLINKQLGVN